MAMISIINDNDDDNKIDNDNFSEIVELVDRCLNGDFFFSVSISCFSLEITHSSITIEDELHNNIFDWFIDLLIDWQDITD